MLIFVVIRIYIRCGRVIVSIWSPPSLYCWIWIIPLCDFDSLIIFCCGCNLSSVSFDALCPLWSVIHADYPRRWALIATIIIINNNLRVWQSPWSLLHFALHDTKTSLMNRDQCCLFLSIFLPFILPWKREIIPFQKLGPVACEMLTERRD